MMRALKPPRWAVQRDIHLLVRSFPSERVRVYRPSDRPTLGSLGTPVWGEVVVYEGEALFVPAGGSVTRFGLGQVEEDRPQMLIPGRWEIRQGDFFERSEVLSGGRRVQPRLYQVDYAPDYWQAFTVVTLRVYQQGT